MSFQLWLGLYMTVMITGIDLSQEIFTVDMLRILKLSLKHRRKHVLRSFQLYGDQSLCLYGFSLILNLVEKNSFLCRCIGLLSNNHIANILFFLKAPIHKESRRKHNYLRELIMHQETERTK